MLENICDRLGQRTLTCVLKHSHTPTNLACLQTLQIFFLLLSTGDSFKGAIWNKRGQIECFILQFQKKGSG